MYRINHNHIMQTCEIPKLEYLELSYCTNMVGLIAFQPMVQRTFNSKSKQIYRVEYHDLLYQRLFCFVSIQHVLYQCEELKENNWQEFASLMFFLLKPLFVSLGDHYAHAHGHLVRKSNTISTFTQIIYVQAQDLSVFNRNSVFSPLPGPFL